MSVDLKTFISIVCGFSSGPTPEELAEMERIETEKRVCCFKNCL